MNANTKLWDEVCKTDPSHTKKFTKGGGFSGTAIKPFYLIRKATEAFGVCGIGWGWKELENIVVGGVWCSKVELWFMQDKVRGTVEQWGQTVMQGTNKNGPFVDEEAPKKAVTDALTKCLSYLGFAGDVHMGRFDDSKYVEEITTEFAGAAKPAAFKNASARNTFCKNVIKSINEAPDCTELKQLAELNKDKIDEMKASGNEHDELAVDEIRKAYAIVRTRLELLENDVAASFGQGFADIDEPASYAALDIPHEAMTGAGAFLNRAKQMKA